MQYKLSYVGNNTNPIIYRLKKNKRNSQSCSIQVHQIKQLIGNKVKTMSFHLLENDEVSQAKTILINQSEANKNDTLVNANKSQYDMQDINGWVKKHEKQQLNKQNKNEHDNSKYKIAARSSQSKEISIKLKKQQQTEKLCKKSNSEIYLRKVKSQVKTKCPKIHLNRKTKNKKQLVLLTTKEQKFNDIPQQKDKNIISTKPQKTAVYKKLTRKISESQRKISQKHHSLVNFQNLRQEEDPSVQNSNSYSYDMKGNQNRQTLKKILEKGLLRHHYRKFSLKDQCYIDNKKFIMESDKIKSCNNFSNQKPIKKRNIFLKFSVRTQSLMKKKSEVHLKGLNQQKNKTQIFETSQEENEKSKHKIMNSQSRSLVKFSHPTIIQVNTYSQNNIVRRKNGQKISKIMNKMAERQKKVKFQSQKIMRR